MKRALVFISLLSVAAFAAEALTVDKLLKDRETLDTKEVVVGGIVSEYRQRESQAGNPYVTFKLKGENKVASVYLQGKLEGDAAPKDGDKVEVSGVFRKEKKVNSNFTVKDEIDATKKEKKKFGVKIIKRKAN